ncbi:MAG TPA: hypothetical protein VIU12_19315 [Chryseolinea sp.]
MKLNYTPFEHRRRPLLPLREFYMRQAHYGLFTALLIFVSLGIGVVGYHFFNDLNWIDSLVNASMILTGMGPVDPLKNDLAKLWASFYAIFSGVAFLTIAAVFLSPIVHRFLHKFNLDEPEQPQKKTTTSR